MAAVVVPVLAIASAGTGCQDQSFSLVWETPRFRYYVENGRAPPCDDVQTWVARAQDNFAAFLDLTGEVNPFIEYYLHSDGASVREICGGNFSACTRGAAVHAFLPMIDHEIVHAVASYMGHPPLLFAEGLAVMLGDEGPDTPGQRADIWEPIETLTTTGAFQSWLGNNGLHAYVGASSLVRYLLDRFGRETLVAFYSSVAYDASQADVSSASERVFGAPLENLLSDWRQQPPKYEDEYRLHLLPCESGPDVMPGGGATIPLACGRFGGGYEGTFHFSTDGQPVNVGVEAAPVMVTIGRCGGGTLLAMPDQLPHDPQRLGARMILDLPPGRYFADVVSEAPAPIAVSVSGASDVFRGEPCSATATTPVEIGPDYSIVVASRWTAQPCSGWPWCPGRSWDFLATSDGLLNWSGFVDEVPANIYSCDQACPTDPGQSCKTYALVDSPRRMPVSAGSIVHVAASNATADAFFVSLTGWLPAPTGASP